MIISEIIFKNKKNIILMHFQAKNTFKFLKYININTLNYCKNIFKIIILKKINFDPPLILIGGVIP
jgi:hypothetical protein